MNKWGTPLFIGLIIILAGVSAYYATRASLLERKLALQPAKQTTNTTTPTTPTPTQTNPTPTPEPTSTVTTSPAAATPVQAPTNLKAGERIASPAETYTVEEGDTLYPIGLKNDMAWERIAEANGLVEPYPLRIGQLLAIPGLNTSTNTFEVVFATDPGKAQAAQTAADTGKAEWRRDPVGTVQAEHGNIYGITNEDDFRLESVNKDEHTAQVTVTRLIDGTTVTHDVFLIQPATQGDDGIWTISRISAQK